MRRAIIYLSLLILLSGIASASFNVGNGSYITKDYNGGETIKGRLNISFTEQNGNSVFTNTFDGQKRLIEVLNDSGFIRGIDYTCNPLDCGKRYATGISGSSSANFDLAQKRYLGFKIIGSGVNLNTANHNFNFNVSSDVEKSCKNQISIDFFDDGKVDFYNKKYGEETCGPEVRGCYNGAGSSYVIIDSAALCEKVRLKPAPAFKAGANVKIEGSGSKTIHFGLFSLNTTSGTTPPYLCGELTNSVTGISSPADESPTEKKISVTINCGVLQETDAYICAWTSSSNSDTGNKKFSIKYESDANSCGGNYQEVSGVKGVVSKPYDYDLFVQPLEYGRLDTLSFADVFKETNGQVSLKNAVDDYLNKTYARNCSNECLIPFSVYRDSGYSGPSNVVVDNIDVRYGSSVGGTSSSPVVYYPLTPTDFVLNMAHKFIDLDKLNFQVPESNGSRIFKIFLDGQEVLRESINVKVGFLFDIYPKFSLIGKETVFYVSGAANGTTSSWNFGDNTPRVNSPSLSATHMYANEGIYNVEVEVKNARNDASTRRFKISVGDPKISLGVLIRDYNEKISDLEKDLTQFPEWTRIKLRQSMNLEGAKNNVSEIQSRYNSLTESANESVYGDLIHRILSINLPDRLYVSERGTLPGDLGFERMDPSIIAAIEEKQITESAATKNAILAWMNENYKFDVSYETIAARQDAVQGNFLRRYIVSIHAKKQIEDTSYLIIGYPSNAIVPRPSDDFRQMTNSSNYYKIISGSENSYEFLIFGSSPPPVEELGIYISPSLSQLNIVPNKPVTPVKRDFPWGTFLLAMLIMLFFIFVIYVILYWWYKNNYEKHLFKNPADLYNIINFIYNSRKSGLRDDEIKNKLKNNKWRGEQITYAFKKIDGRRTGMFEIPIFKFIENKRVKREIQKRQGSPPDARFIKRPF